MIFSPLLLLTGHKISHIPLRPEPIFAMSPQPPNMAPFTEDPTEERLTEYVKFIKSSITPSICEHKMVDGKMRLIGGEVDLIWVNAEKKEKDEGSIYQKDLFTFSYHHLGKEKPEPAPEQGQKKEDTNHGEDENRQEEQPRNGQGGPEDPKKQWNRSGYWEIEVADSPLKTIPPIPVFQFATFCLEVHPYQGGVIK